MCVCVCVCVCEQRGGDRVDDARAFDVSQLGLGGGGGAVERLKCTDSLTRSDDEGNLRQRYPVPPHFPPNV